MTSDNTSPEAQPDWEQAFQRRVIAARNHHWLWRQWVGEGQYVVRRYGLITLVLHWARSGSLLPDWREHQLPTFLSRSDIADQAFGDTQALIVTELAALPVQPWEPYAAGGDWREALDAWYSDLLANETYLDQNRPPRAGPEIPVEMLAELDEDTNERQHHATNEKVYQRGRTENRIMLGASYRAGLAAGGEPIDWRGWLQQQLGRPVPADAYHWYQSLPHYWTEQHP